MRLLLLLLLLACATSAAGQTQFLVTGSGTPTGYCSHTRYIDKDNGTIYECDEQTNTWGAGTASTKVPNTRTVNGHALGADVTVSKSDVGLGSVDNTADTAKPVSTAQQTALNLKANLASPTFTGTVSGITASMVGLGNVANTAQITNVGGTSPIASSGGTTPTISINDSAADGSTKGAAAFNSNDFNASSGVITLDYTNAQAASGSNKGFLTSADWTTFNNKVATTRSVSTSSPITGGGDLSADRTLACSTCATTTNGGALSGTSPVAISAAGAISCTTCATTTNGGALSGTSPIAVSAAGAISCTTCITTSASQVLNHPTIGIAGTSASAQILAVGTAPSCAFSTGGGTGPSCALETGSTDFAGTMTLTTGSGSPSSTGTITLTFNAANGTNSPVCIAGLVKGGTDWSVSSTVRVTTQSTTAPVFSWASQSATAAVNLTTSTTYKMSYLCIGK